jgi:hypothetical protein
MYHMSKKAYKAAAAISIFILLQGLAAAISSPNATQTVSEGQNVNFSVDAPQQQNVELEINPPKLSNSIYEMNYSSGRHRATLNSPEFPRKGLYQYRFTGGGETFPEDGYFSLTVSSLNQTLEEKSLNGSDSESQSAQCDFKTSNDFSCEYEHYQAQMILSSAIGMYLNRSDYSREKFYNFTFSQYGDDSETFSECDRADNDFDCETTTLGGTVYSGTRQGALIRNLWKAYELTGNESVRELAVNYTRGTANSCNIWDNEFRCNSSRAQASMALGYWEAYEKTGNETYRSFADRLTDSNYSSPKMVAALLEGYRFTSNDTYMNRAQNVTDQWLDNCPDCSAQSFQALINALWKGYSVTGDFGYYRHAANLSSYRNGSYCSFNSTQCSKPYVQGLRTSGLWKAYRAQKDVSAGFYAPDIDGKTVVGENISVQVQMQGKIESPEALYRQRNSSSWKTCEIDFFTGCDIPGGNVTNQTPYSFKLSSEEASFPVNGSFSFAPSLVKENFLDEAQAFSLTDPESACAPSEDDFSCEDYAVQPPMIQAFTKYSLMNSSQRSSHYLENILSPPYVTTQLYSSLCNQGNDGYIYCETGGFRNTYTGSVRQGRMIRALFSAYEVNGKGITYERAMNYTRGSAEDCDVWQENFSCASPRGQAEMIDGFLEAYRYTGNRTFRKIAYNLTEKAVSMPEKSRVGASLWKSSSMFNESHRNLSIVEEASNISDSFQNYCAGNCTPLEYIGVNKLFKSAYLYSGEDYSDEYRNSILNTTDSGSCGPYKRDNSCSSPGFQGQISELLWRAAYTMPVKLKVSDTFNVSSDQVTVGKQISSTCKVRNQLENTTLKNIGFEIETSEGLAPASNNTSYNAGNVEFGNSSQISWDIDTLSSGPQNVSCAITSDSGYRDTITRDILVEEQKKEETSESDSSTGTPPVFGGFEPEGEERNFTVRYNKSSELQWNKSLLQSLDLNLTYRQFFRNRTCFSAKRKIQGQETSLTVSWDCESYEKIVIDPLPSNVTAEANRSDYAVGVYRNTSPPVETNYQGLNTTNFSNPLLLTVDYEKPDVEISNFSTSQLDNGTAMLSADLNRPVNCRVLREGEEIYSEETTALDYEVSPAYGNTTYRVECGDQSFIRTFTRHRSEVPEKDGQGEGLPLGPLSGVFIAAVIMSGIYYREEIVDTVEMKVFEYRFSRFQDAVEKEDTAAAIEVFDSMSRDVSQEVIESDMQLMHGLMLYLLLDLVEEGKKDVEFDVSGDLDELVKRYVMRSDDKATRLVSRKYREVMGAEIGEE